MWGVLHFDALMDDLKRTSSHFHSLPATGVLKITFILIDMSKTEVKNDAANLF